MPITEPFIALRALRIPGTMAWGFQPGDGVPQATVDNWGLEIGVDVMPRDTGVVPRPADDADRSEWEAYAIGQGMDPETARNASLSELKGIPEPDPEEPPQPLPDPNAPPERPAPDALKADWIAYVVAMGADETWANDRSTTKADLQDYEPKRDFPPAGTDTVVTPPANGDTVAEQATDIQNDANRS